MPPVELRRGTWAFSRGATGASDLHSCVRGDSGFYSRRCSGIRPYLELERNSVSFRLAAGTTGFLSRFNR